MKVCQACGGELRTCGKCGWSKVYEEDMGGLREELDKYKGYVDTTNYNSEQVAIKATYLEMEIEQLRADNAALLECLLGTLYQYEYGVMVSATENIKMIRECIAKLGGGRDE